MMNMLGQGDYHGAKFHEVYGGHQSDAIQKFEQFFKTEVTLNFIKIDI